MTTFGDLVKAVVDLKRGIMLVDAELQADQEAELLTEGSAQSDLWGINLYPDLPEADWIEFDSMINVRPAQGNRSRDRNTPQQHHSQHHPAQTGHSPTAHTSPRTALNSDAKLIH